MLRTILAYVSFCAGNLAAAEGTFSYQGEATPDGLVLKAVPDSSARGGQNHARSF